MTSPGGLAASVHQRLLNKAALEHRPFYELLQYHGPKVAERLFEMPDLDSLSLYQQNMILAS